MSGTGTTSSSAARSTFMVSRAEGGRGVEEDEVILRKLRSPAQRGIEACRGICFPALPCREEGQGLVGHDEVKPGNPSLYDGELS